MVLSDLTKSVIPLPIVVGLVAMAGSGFFWLANEHSANVANSERIHQLEMNGSSIAVHALETANSQTNRLIISENQISINTSRLARLEAQVEGIHIDLERIERERSNATPGSH